ncbi:unnamed protein product [Cochlearia groenlandica]
MGSSTSKTTSSSETNQNSNFSSLPPTTVHKAFSFPMPPIHHPPSKNCDTHHFVSLKSTTYGSLLLVDHDQTQQTSPHKNKNETEPSRDSVINTWELMNDLDDDDDDDESDIKFESFSKPFTNQDLFVNGSASKSKEPYEIEENWITLSSRPKQPLWKHLSEESFLSELDPNIVSSYKKALSSKSKPIKPVSTSHTNDISLSSTMPLKETEKPTLLATQDNKNKIVLYFTSLRGIRKTYEDCCVVRSILRGFRVMVEEKDISMDSNYKKELRIALGEEHKTVCLPHVFIRGKHIGGIEEIKMLNDGGELRDILRDFPACESTGDCDNCGDARFMMCTSCGGSTKVFQEEEDVFKRCKICNENGLVRCNKCCI